MKLSEPDTDESLLNSRLIAYASDQVGYKKTTTKKQNQTKQKNEQQKQTNLFYFHLTQTIQMTTWTCITVQREKYKYEQVPLML